MSPRAAQVRELPSGEPVRPSVASMLRISYHASHEQFAPSRLLSFAVAAEEAGFDAVFCSDHLQPWAPVQGHAGHTWTWMAAALQATRRVPFSTITIPGGWRYHPVSLAHAIGSLGEMFPGRLTWLAFGSGEAVNEATVGAGWPAKPERNQRLREGVQIIRALLAGETVSCHGELHAEGARLWERAASPPLLFGAAISEGTARMVGAWADGLLTVGRDLARLERVIAAFREGGGEGKPVHVKLDVNWGPDDASALDEAWTHWRFNALDNEVNTSLRQPEDFVKATRHLQPADLHAHVLVSNDPGRHLAHLDACRSLGVASIDVHQVGLDQLGFIDAYATRVLPACHR